MSLINNLKLGKVKNLFMKSNHESIDGRMETLDDEIQKQQEKLDEKMDEYDRIFDKYDEKMSKLYPTSSGDFTDEFDKLVDAQRKENESKLR